MTWKAFFLISIAAAQPLAAQSVKPASSTIVLFSDPAYGVSFRYPASWAFSKAPALGSIPVKDQLLRAVVFKKRIRGIESWPMSNFAGDELEYAIKPHGSRELCRKLAFSTTDIQGGVDQRRIDGVTWNHDESDTASLGHEVIDDDYTAYSKNDGGVCLLFDLRVHYLNNRPGNSPPRFLSRQELATAKAELGQVFSTVHIASPLHPTASERHP
jgi:hypothetical protein